MNILNLEQRITYLQEVLKSAPKDIALRKQLAEALLITNKLSDAEHEYLIILSDDANDSESKLGLADCLEKQGKGSEAIPILESLLQLPNPPARSFVLHEKCQQQKSAAAAITTDYGVLEGKMEEALAGLPDLPALNYERPGITFKDVGGMEELKEEIRLKIIYPLQHPELYQAYGKKTGGGILFYGPPGCGKTHLARATAGEIKASFISVGISDVLDMWLGSSEKNLHLLFEQARRSAPCVMFFDEVDALGASRSDLRQSAGRHLINQFLAEMDGDKYTNEGVLILGATNAPWHLDSAFRRPGRFDRIIFVPPPNESARESILRLLLQSRPTKDIHFEIITKKTEGFSGADLQAVVDIAVEAKLKEAMKDGIPKPLVTADILLAARIMKTSVKEWFATAKNFAVYSNESGIYDEILRYLKLL